MHLLDGSRLKLVRAHEHRDALHNKATKFLDGEPHALALHKHSKWEFSILLKVGEETDPYWGVLLGDFLHNLRSALDHLARALVKLNRGRPTGLTAFPIFTDECEFKVKGLPMLKGASAAAIALAQELQPYHRREPDDHPLTKLRVLSNADKHRLLHTTAFIPQGVAHRIVDSIGTGQLEILKVVSYRPVKHDTEILRARFIPRPGFEKMNMHFQFRAEIVVSDRWRLEDVLDLNLFVRDQVIGRFERFFEEPPTHD